MFELVEASSFVRKMANGRTRPMLILCEAEGVDGPVDVVVKLSGGCELREKSLIREAIAAFYAADLGLPIPCPYKVHLSPQFIDTITDSEARQLANDSCAVAYGCHLVEGYATIAPSMKLTHEELAPASEIFAFDLMLGNPDRCQDRPNCLHNGTTFAIFDHELAFSHFDLFLGQPMPWIEGDGAKMVAPVESHIFYRELKGKALDLLRLEQVIRSVTAARFSEYRDALPAAWKNLDYVDKLIDYLKSIQQNIDGTINEVRRVLA